MFVLLSKQYKRPVDKHPVCQHEPTLLFRNDNECQRFYACSAYRDQNECLLHIRCNEKTDTTADERTLLLSKMAVKSIELAKRKSMLLHTVRANFQIMMENENSQKNSIPTKNPPISKSSMEFHSF